MKMENNAQKRKKEIIKVLLWFNVLFLIISIFYVSKSFSLLITLVNIMFLCTFLILEKYSPVFDGLIVSNKFSKGLNKVLGEV